MTTAASFTALHAPVAEDSMEMSSPANPTYDDDIDIDFDDNVGGVELTDDERMLEDNEQPRPATATDDMMEDDVPQQDMHVPEQEMQDGFDAAAYEQVDPDDELIDYGEDEYEDMAQTHDQTVYEPPAPEIPIEDREPEEPNLEQVDEEVVREPEAFVPEPESVPQPELVAVEETSSEPVPADQDADATETGAPNDTAVAVAEAAKNEGDVHAEIEANEGNAANDAGDAVTAVDEEHASHHVAPAPLEEPFPELPAESPEEQISAPVPAPLDTSLDAGADAPSTPTDTGLHPMVVQYGDWEWPLFKSSRQPEGLLKDDNLASVALADLLNNCRYRLAQKVGEDISNDQEFVLRFDSMGLAIVENSPSAFNTSLDEILEVYKQLHINDGAQTIPPFWLHLSLQPKFTSYLTMLKQAAAGGQGISSFVDVPADEVPENFGEYYPDGDDDPTLYGDASAAEYHDHQDHDDQHAVAEPQLAEGDYHEYDTSYANTEGGQEVQEGYHQYDETEQAEYEDYGEGDETNAPAENYDNADDDEAANAHARVEDPESVYNGDDAPQLEETDSLSHVDGEAHNTVLDGESEVQTTSAQEALGEAAGEAEGEGEGSHVESAASSTTLRADQANDSVEHGTDDNDESSTFLAEVDVEATDGSGADNGTHADSAANVAAHEATVLGESSILSDKDGHEAILEFVEVENDGSDQQNDETENAAASVHQSSGDEQHEPAQDESDLDSPQLEAQAAPAKEDHAHEAEESANGTVLDGATGNDEDYIDFGDDIDFDDDTYEQHEARKASEANNSGSKSPLGKRPLDQTGGVDLAEEPELKKVRSS